MRGMNGMRKMERGSVAGSKWVWLAVLAALPGCPASHGSRLSVETSVKNPVVAMDGHGNGTIAWTEEDGLTRTGSIRAAKYVHDAGFQKSNRITDEAPRDGVSLAMDGRGNAYLAWPTSLDAVGTKVAVARTTSADGVWTTPSVLDRDLRYGGYLSDVSIVADAGGGTLVAFAVHETIAGVPNVRIMASVTPPDWSWAAPIVIATTTAWTDSDSSAFDLGLVAAVNRAGVAAVAYSSYVGIGPGLFVHRFETGADPLLPEQVDEGGIEPTRFSGAPVVVTSDGVILAFWVATTPTSAPSTLFARCHRPGSGWGPADAIATLPPLSGPGLRALEFDAGADAAGNVMIRIGATFADYDVAEYRAWSPAGGWSGPIPGAPKLSSFHEARFVAGAGGGGILLGTNDDSQRFDGTPPRASFFAPGGGWSELRDFGASGGRWNGDPVPAAMDGSGTTLCAWISDQGLQGQAWRAPTADFETSGGAPIAGAPARFTAAPTKLWTTDATLLRSEWDFDGDGVFDATDDDPSDGSTATWTFPSSGTFPVTLRVTDDWDEVGVVTWDVVVGDPGPGGDWLLTVGLGGGGHGRVTADLESDGTLEIDCPTDCEERCADGIYVFLRPIPDAGSSFVRWEGLDTALGDLDYGLEGCTVHMVADRTITAVFEPSVP